MKFVSEQLSNGMIDLDVDLIPKQIKQVNKTINDNTFGNDLDAHRQSKTTYPHSVTNTSFGTVVEAFLAL